MVEICIHFFFCCSNIVTTWLPVFDNAYLLFVFVVLFFHFFVEKSKMLNGRANMIVTIGNILSKKGD